MVKILPSPTAAQARDEAMARVDAHADPDWKQSAVEAVLTVARRHVTFTTDQVWGELTSQGVSEPHERRAMGPVITRLVRAGEIECVGFEQSTDPVRHARPVRVYRSASYSR